MTIEIKDGGLDDARVVQLLAIHVAKARAQTAPESAHALDLSGLRAPDIQFWAAWAGENVLGTAALKRLSPNDGEVKSMHTALEVWSLLAANRANRMNVAKENAIRPPLCAAA